jgi:hypothetical protein
MNSEWFIFKGTHHIGPFTKREIESMLKRGDLNDNTLVWKEGEAKWDTLKASEHFQYLFLPEIPKSIEVPPALPVELPPALPKAPHLSKIDSNNDDSADLPPPIPTDTLLNNKKDHSIPKIQFKGIKDFDLSKIVLYSMAALFLLIIAWNFLWQSSNEVHLKIRDLMPTNLERLDRAASDSSSNLKVGIALSMNSKKIYVSTNSNREIDVTIKLNPIKSRMLGENAGPLLIRGRIIDHLGTFDKVVMKAGSEFISGEYLYDISFLVKHPLISYLPILSSFSLDKKLNHVVMVKGKEVIFAGSKRDFEEKIIKYNEETYNQKAKPQLERLERINTIASLLEQMTNKYNEVLNEAKTGAQMKTFETYYTKEVAPIIQSLIVGDDDQLKNFNDLIKQVGALAVKMSTSVQPSKKLSESDKKQIQLNHSKIIDGIKLQIELNHRRIDDEIKKIQ